MTDPFQKSGNLSFPLSPSRSVTGTQPFLLDPDSSISVDLKRSESVLFSLSVFLETYKLL